MGFTPIMLPPAAWPQPRSTWNPMLGLGPALTALRPQSNMGNAFAPQQPGAWMPPVTFAPQQQQQQQGSWMPQVTGAIGSAMGNMLGGPLGSAAKGGMGNAFAPQQPGAWMPPVTFAPQQQGSWNSATGLGPAATAMPAWGQSYGDAPYSNIRSMPGSNPAPYSMYGGYGGSAAPYTGGGGMGSSTYGPTSFGGGSSLGTY